MPDLRRRNCQTCGRPDTEVGPISWRGNCHGCGHARMHANCDAIHFKTGPEFRLWRQRMAASVGAVLTDEQADAA